MKLFFYFIFYFYTAKTGQIFLSFPEDNLVKVYPVFTLFVETFHVLGDIPRIEAKVPTAALADMMGKLGSRAMRDMDLVANGWMHFQNFLKGAFDAFKDVTPVLAPCLGMVGVGFGFINRNENSIAAAKIIAEVNRANTQIINATNQRINALKDYVDQTARRILEKGMSDHYKGQNENWNNCINEPTLEDANYCQRDVARDVNGLKFIFMNEQKFKRDPDGEMSVADIRVLEMQLPLLRTWAVFHLKVLAVLLLTYEKLNNEKGGTYNAKMYDNYKVYMSDNGNVYISYIEWAMRRIRQTRITDNKRDLSPFCTGYSDDISWRFYGRYLSSTHQRCSFKPSTFSFSECNKELTQTCSNCRCCLGFFGACNTDTAEKASFHNTLSYMLRSDMDDIHREYMEKLAPNFDNFWKREIDSYLPTLKLIMEDPRLALSDEEKQGTIDEVTSFTAQNREEVAESGDDVDKKNLGKNLSEEEKERYKAIIKENAQTKADEGSIQAGTTGRESNIEYLKKIDDNVTNFLLRTKKLRKKKKARQGKQSNN